MLTCAFQSGQQCCRDAASAELELDQLQEVQLAFQKMDIYSGAADTIYQSLAQAMGWLLQWLKGKADGSCLSSKGYERFEGVWAGHQVLPLLHPLTHAGTSKQCAPPAHSIPTISAQQHLTFGRNRLNY